MKNFLAIAALLVAGYSIWIAPQIHRLAKTPKSDPQFEFHMAKMKRLNKTSRILAGMVFGVFIVLLLTTTIRFE